MSVGGARLVAYDLGRMGYRDAWALQRALVERAVGGRSWGDPVLARVLVVEHDPPVITLGRRPGSREHLLVDASRLEALGVELVESDRGGDVTYHGPGQLVVYPVVDLNRAGKNLHAYMRLLEQAVIDALATLGVEGGRDEEATGVWVRDPAFAGAAKICAMGVRVKRWVTSHGLALNVDPQLDHFGLIVPCGLEGRPVTSLRRLLGARTPAPSGVARGVVDALGGALGCAVSWSEELPVLSRG